MPTSNVLLAGRSLLLSAVAASLADTPGLRVSQAGSLSAAASVLLSDGLDVVIYDVSQTPDPELLVQFLSHPGVCLIGLDSECNRAVVLTGRQIQAPTLQQIRDTINAAVCPS